MSGTHRLRVELPDHPGALAQVAAIIASQSGNVLSVDIHELDGSTAIDEIVVQSGEGWDPAMVADALERTGAGVLLSCQPGAAPTDPVVRALSWTASMLTAVPHDSELELARALAEACTYAHAWVCPVTSALSMAAGRLALERGQPVIRRSGDVPEQYAGDLPATVWLLAVPDGHLDAQLVAFLARPTSLRFTASEVARVEALMSLRRQLSVALGGRAQVPPTAASA